MCVHSWTQFDIYRIKAIMIIILKIYWGPDPVAGSRRFTLDTIHSKTINMTKTFPLRPFNHLRPFPDGANVSFTSFLCLRHTATNLRYHMSHRGMISNSRWLQPVNGCGGVSSLFTLIGLQLREFSRAELRSHRSPNPFWEKLGFAIPRSNGQCGMS